MFFTAIQFHFAEVLLKNSDISIILNKELAC
jgi:hypothetical protein